MKSVTTSLSLFVLLVFFVANSPAEDDYRQWQMRDGRRSRIPMTVVEIDSRIVTLKREDNGRLVRVVITGLSDEDRAYLDEQFPDRGGKATETAAASSPADAPLPAGETRWPAPQLTDDNLDRWLDFIRPSEAELSWRKEIRWHNNLASAQEEARRLRRPILLWTMNGNPCGET